MPVNKRIYTLDDIMELITVQENNQDNEVVSIGIYRGWSLSLHLPNDGEVDVESNTRLIEVELEK